MPHIAYPDVIEADDIDIDAYLCDDEIPEYRLRSQNYSADDEDKHVPYAAGIMVDSL